MKRSERGRFLNHVMKSFRASCLIALGLVASHGLASDADVMTICHGYGCRFQVRFRLTDDQFREVQAVLSDSQTPEGERTRIAQAVLRFYEYAARVAPIADDRGGNHPYDPDTPGKMDCIDHATSVSSFLAVLGSSGLLQFHQPLPKAHRSFLVVFRGHWSAQIMDLYSQTAYVVDRWPYDYGSEPLIIETRTWKKIRNPVGKNE
jgi:hypothetical protein